MQVEFGRLVTALGQAVSEAQRAVAAHAIGNYLAYFRRGPADQDGGAGYTPNTTSILFPPSTGGEEGKTNFLMLYCTYVFYPRSHPAPGCNRRDTGLYRNRLP